MKPAFTDLFVKRPVLALVVNLVIVIAGLQAWNSLSVRQYPQSDNASVVILTPYIGASAEVVRGFVTTAIERAVSSADGIDYVESKSLLGLSLVTARLKLNYDATKALADITAKVNQVRNELPPEAELPSISVQSADSEFAAAYLSFASATMSQSEITDYLVRVVQPRFSALAGVQRADIFGARTFAMRVWLDPARLAAYNLSPGEVRRALAANNTLAAVGSTKGNLVQVNLTANTDLRSVEEFRQMVLLRLGDSVVRLQDVATVELGAEDYDTNVSFNGQTAVFMGIFPLPNANTIEVVQRVREDLASFQSDLPVGLAAEIGYDASEYIDNAIQEVVGTLTETLAIVVIVIFLFLGSVRSVLVPVVAIPVSLIGAIFLMQIFGFTPQPADPAGHRAVGGAGSGRCDRDGGERREAPSRGALARGSRADRRAGAGGAGDCHDYHAGGGVYADWLAGRADRCAVPGVRTHLGRCRDDLGDCGTDVIADDERQVAQERRGRGKGLYWRGQSCL
jgi:multidrug efflux pump